MDDPLDMKISERRRAFENNYRSSTFRERMIEHFFLAELLQEFWIRQDVVEVSRPEVDSGCDLILEARDVIRHVQLKTMARGAKTARQKIQLSLGRKPSGCVVLLEFECLPSGRLGLRYRFFGGQPGHPMQNIIHAHCVKHSKSNAMGEKAVRPKLRYIPKGEFEPVGSIKELGERLFGPASKRE